MNNKILSSIALLGLIGTFGATHTHAATNEVSGDQNVKAIIENGGISGGIVKPVDPETGEDMGIEDVDFGTLKVGQDIEKQHKDSLVSVIDHSGGTGWTLTAQHKNVERDNSLQLSVQVDGENEVNLNDSPQVVTSGVSQLDEIVKGGDYIAAWGTHPKAGAFNNVIEWNLSTNVTE